MIIVTLAQVGDAHVRLPDDSVFLDSEPAPADFQSVKLIWTTAGHQHHCNVSRRPAMSSAARSSFSRMINLKVTLTRLYELKTAVAQFTKAVRLYPYDPAAT